MVSRGGLADHPCSVIIDDRNRTAVLFDLPLYQVCIEAEPTGLATRASLGAARSAEIQSNSTRGPSAPRRAVHQKNHKYKKVNKTTYINSICRN